MEVNALLTIKNCAEIKRKAHFNFFVALGFVGQYFWLGCSTSANADIAYRSLSKKDIRRSSTKIGYSQWASRLNKMATE